MARARRLRDAQQAREIAWWTAALSGMSMGGKRLPDLRKFLDLRPEKVDAATMLAEKDEFFRRAQDAVNRPRDNRG